MWFGLFASRSFLVPLWWLWKCHLTICLWGGAPLPGAFSSWWSHLVYFVPSWYGHLCFVSHTFREARSSRLCAMCPYDWAQPRPPSALASVASECRTLHRLTCWEDMCSLKRWTRPSKKGKRKKNHHAFCKGGLFVGLQPVCWWIELLGQSWALMRLPIMCAQRESPPSPPSNLLHGQPVRKISPAAFPSPH